MEDPFGDLDLDDECEKTPVAPRKVMPASYPYPLVADGLFNVDLSLPFSETFNESKLAPSNIQSLIERLYLLKDYSQCLHLASLWIKENSTREKPFGCLEVCDIAARSALRLGDIKSAIRILEASPDVDLTHPTQTTAGVFMFYARLLREAGDGVKALNVLTLYFKVRAKDFRGFMELYEVVKGRDGMAFVAALAVRRAKWLFSQSMQPYLVDTPLMKRHDLHEVARIDAALEEYKAVLEAFDTSDEDEVLVKDRLVEAINEVLPGLEVETLDWIRTDVFIKSSASNELLDEGEDEEGPSVARM
ncbi:UNVERIFIED_CONTAM: hypothetical protein HDU68_001187 [Siphonaria sp. JEL0065]|nr:hypothetical protein HDU68_001187 [Siphonaria sp. JEL0065]